MGRGRKKVGERRANPNSCIIKLDSPFWRGMLKASEDCLRILACCTCLTLIAVLSASIEPSHAQDTPWKRRMRTGVVLDDSSAPGPTARAGSLDAEELHRLGLRPRGIGLIDLSFWPEEPPSPADVTPDALARAMRQLCPASVDSEQLRRYAIAIVRYGRQFSVDPWLLAALVYTQGNCSTEIDNGYGTGLTLINVGMHERHIRGGHYHYAVRTGRGWTRRDLDVSAFPFRRATLQFRRGLSPCVRRAVPGHRSCLSIRSTPQPGLALRVG